MLIPQFAVPRTPSPIVWQKYSHIHVNQTQNTRETNTTQKMKLKKCQNPLLKLSTHKKKICTSPRHIFSLSPQCTRSDCTLYTVQCTAVHASINRLMKLLYSFSVPSNHNAEEHLPVTPLLFFLTDFHGKCSRIFMCSEDFSSSTLPRRPGHVL